jgi:two-component system, OmpR family, KDP operon response regulator KdpE
MSGERILVVDDEPEIRKALEKTLRGAGYDVDAAASGEDALVRASVHPPEAVILDLVLPGKSGVEVTRELREWSEAPVLIMSVVGEEPEKVAALDAGADDYVTKPFGMEELLARLRATLRRTATGSEPLVRIGQLEVDLDKRSVKRDGELIQLTPHEFRLLRLFATNEGKLLTPRTILREVWGPAYQSESHYLHVYVSQLRRKIEPDSTRPRYLLTETGAGYRFVDPKS